MTTPSRKADKGSPAPQGGSLPPSSFSCLPESSSHHPPQPPVYKRYGNYETWEPSGDPQTDLSQEFRHTGWHDDRTRVYHALWSCSFGQRRLKAFCQCGMNAIVMRARKGDEQYKITSLRCKDRFCKVCSRERSARVKAKLLPAIGKKAVRMITLTLRAGTDDKLAPTVARLKEAFQQLRRLKIWTNAVDGEAHFLEATRGRNHDHWHVHYHVLAVGRYIEVGWLSQAWHAITRDSPIVHVTLARTLRGVAAYVGKYASKGLDVTTLRNPDLLQEAIAALRSARLWDSTGSLRKAMQEAEKDDYLRADEWEPVMPLWELYAAAARGDPSAKRIIFFLRVRDPETGDPPTWLTMENSS